jgi:hypothetical protein
LPSLSIYEEEISGLNPFQTNNEEIDQYEDSSNGEPSLEDTLITEPVIPKSDLEYKRDTIQEETTNGDDKPSVG